MECVFSCVCVRKNISDIPVKVISKDQLLREKEIKTYLLCHYDLLLRTMSAFERLGRAALLAKFF